MEVTDLILVFILTSLVTSASTDAEGVIKKSATSIPATCNSNTTKFISCNNSIITSNSELNAPNCFPNKTQLDLSYRCITELPAGRLSKFKDLEVLNLSGNKLQTFQNETFSSLTKLKKLYLQGNPWNCMCPFLKLIKWMNESGIETEGGTCTSPEQLANKSVLDVISTCNATTEEPPVITNSAKIPTAASATAPTPTSTATTTTLTTTFTTTLPTTAQQKSHVVSSTLGSLNISIKDSLTETGQIGVQQPGVSNTWKFLAGVIVIALCTSMFIICAVKSPSWYKLFFNYRHQRLREVEDPNTFSTGRYSNFSLDTEQTETSAHDLDQGLEQPLEDEDGFIEDGYIQPNDYKDHTENYKEHTEVYEDHSDADEV
ncbi:leucine-rich repeat-containing protein 19-like [Hoplias malabaricus]|uniref:leucine-rich repeat-containing protein 19-like n=1 Tax=Hoplias malabaricus TaxID=27720 RepID=UPI003461E4BC